MTVGQRIQEQITKKGWTQTATAAKLGLSLTYLNYLLNGHARCTARVALKLEKVFGVPAGQWLAEQIETDLAKARRGKRVR